MKKAIRVICFFCILAVLLVGMYKVFSWKDTSGAYFSSVKQLNVTPENTVDVVFLGSSHVYCGVSPYVFWNKAGISAFDMSVSGMDKWSELEYTKYFLTRQKPKLICVDAYSFTYGKNVIKANEYRNMLSLPISKYSIDLIKSYNYDDKEAQTDYFLKWPIIHTRYKEITKADFITEGFGEYGRGENVPNDIPGYSFSLADNVFCDDIIDVDSINKAIIDEFISISNEYGIPVLFFVTPCSQSLNEVAIYNGIEKYVNDYDNIFFCNCNKEVLDLLSSQSDFTDFTHLNRSGSDKFSSWLCDYINSRFDLKDHRGDDGYDLWNSDAIHYYIHDDIIALKNRCAVGIDAVTLLNEVVGRNYLQYVVSFDGDYYEYDYPYEEILYVIGAPVDDWRSGGTWIGNGETSVKVADASTQGFVYYNLDRYNEVRVAKDADLSTPSVYINDTACQEINNGVSVIVWDTINKEIVYKYGWN